MKRMWVNQPSDSQPYHHLHGTNVLVEPEPGRPVVRVYFLDGAVVSQEVHKSCLSEGWVAPLGLRVCAFPTPFLLRSRVVKDTLAAHMTPLGTTSHHSSRALTLPMYLNALEKARKPYRLTAHPGMGYYLESTIKST